tara:strand:- start:1207 stop:1779 length:573 start_codon:yes stop_codon:yes gene_type:complete
MLTDFISIYENALTPEYCKSWIEYIEYLRKEGIITQEESKLHNRDHQTINFSNDDAFDLNSSDKLSRSFLPSIKNCVDNYLKDYSVLGSANYLLYDVKAKRIPICGGFHAWHYENSSFETATRRFVVQAYLNTIENGGETEFLYQNKRINAVEGTVVIWPAGFTHVHRGNPPIGQDKYILTTWGMLQSNT